MYGPTRSDWWTLFVICGLIGGLLALGLEHGCGFIVRHVEINWK